MADVWLFINGASDGWAYHFCKVIEFKKARFSALTVKNNRVPKHWKR